MNKRIFSLLMIGSVLSLFSCDSGMENPSTTFEDYETFLSLIEGWIEPENYSFSYTFAYGDVYVSEPVTVTISSGTAAVDYGNQETLPDDYGDINFESIAEILTFFNNWWKDVSAAEDTNNKISFSVTYESVSNVTYPQLLNEFITPINSSYDGGYGGIYISISDFSIP